MAYSAGIDVGSVVSKAVIANDGAVVSHYTLPSGGNYRHAAQKVIEGALLSARLSLNDIASIAATGYGAPNVPFSSHKVTEISCQARGINCLFPEARTIIEIGGQASKVIRVDEEGRAIDFVVSERCAAGSGRLLQVIARVLGVGLDEIGEISLKSKKAVEFTTSCAVFAESETISRIAEGTSKEDILAGVHDAMATKISNLLERVRYERECALTGGGAKDIGLVKSVEQKIGVKLLVPEEPQITAALGAALIAQEKASLKMGTL